MRQLMRQVINDHPDAAPRELAEIAAKLTDQQKILEFYTDALVAVARELLREERNAALSGVANGEPTATPNRSAKLRDRRSWWQRMLDSRVHVGSGRWKRLADCTVEDLRYIINEREDEIAALRININRYQSLIDKMQAHGAKTVADLPEQEAL